MNEPCPSNLDEEGKDLWQQCAWVLEGGAVHPQVSLQMHALAIRRELRLESAQNRSYAEMASRLRDLARRIGPARTPESIREELEKMADLYAIWGGDS